MSSPAAPGPPVSLRIVSGGQTGVDRAALDAALALGLPCGGWCPQGRKAEDGPIDPRYPLRETPTDRYTQRTAWNVRDSGGTLVLLRGAAVGGTATTLAEIARLRRPSLTLELPGDLGAQRYAFAAWMQAHRIAVLNVAGPRESTCPGIQAETLALLRALWAPWAWGAPQGN